MPDYAAIYPPRSLQRQWGYEAAQTADPSTYMRRRIAEWCAREGARLAMIEIAEHSIQRQ